MMIRASMEYVQMGSLDPSYEWTGYTGSYGAK